MGLQRATSSVSWGHGGDSIGQHPRRPAAHLPLLSTSLRKAQLTLLLAHEM